MSLTPDEFERIARLRGLFFDESRGQRQLRDYWRGAADLAAYDRVLAARIGWKWDAALSECRDRGFQGRDDATVLDFGCGTGIAARRFVARFGAGEVWCHDRSPAAMAFAVDAVEGARASALPDVRDAAPDVLLVSHVLNELDKRGLGLLEELIARSRRVILVEAGNRETSRRLSALRDVLLADFEVIAPCPHAEACPTLANANDWCHFFAPPPPEVFTDGDWVRTARELGIDLRALPYAFLALTREPFDAAPPPNRLLGRPRIQSREALVQLCTPDGIEQAAVGKRDDTTTYRALKKQPETVRSLPPTD